MSKHFELANGNLYYTGAAWPKTRKQALLLSIEKWQAIVELHKAGVVDIDHADGETCALCQLYEAAENSCDNCPIMQKTGKPECHRTPYPDWRYEDPDNRVKRERAAKAELRFLQDLYAELYPGKQGGKP